MAEARGDKPLAGRVVLVTRAREQAGAFAELLEAAGARVMLVPTIAIEPPDSWAPLDAALAEEHQWVVFTSVNGVAMVRRRVEATGRGRALLERSRLAAIGPATAGALRDWGWPPRSFPGRKSPRRCSINCGRWWRRETACCCPARRRPATCWCAS